MCAAEGNHALLFQTLQQCFMLCVHYPRIMMGVAAPRSRSRKGQETFYADVHKNPGREVSTQITRIDITEVPLSCLFYTQHPHWDPLAIPRACP